MIALATCLVVGAKGAPRLRAGGVLWGVWLLVLVVVFSASGTINTYYTGALTPPIAGALGSGLALLWERRRERQAALTAAAAVAVSCGYATWLLHVRGVGTLTGLPEIALALGVCAIVVLLYVAFAKGAVASSKLAPALAAVALLAAPAAASASVVKNDLGPFDTPFEPVSGWTLARALGAIAGETRPLWPPLARAQGLQPDLMATQTSAVAAPFIYDTGQEVVPIGGIFTGTIPEPSLDTLEGA